MFQLLQIFVCCIYAVNAKSIEYQDGADQKRIIGGETLSIKDAPYQVSIIDLSRGTHTCGGSIISENYLLTAGHCAYKPAQHYRIRSGSSYSSKDGTLHKVTKVIQHEGYKAEFLVGIPVHDIALMKVSPPFELNRDESSKKVELFDKGEKTKTGDKALLTGWGRTTSESSKAASQLQGLKVEMMDVKTCAKSYIDRGGIGWNQICAKYPTGGRDMCNGDSGGPLVIDGRQVGIVSWTGPGCAQPGRPGVYTEVAAYRNWIDRNAEL